MKLKWLQKRITFLVIPDAASRVVRFKLSGWALSLMTFGAALLASLAITFCIGQLLLGITSRFEQTVHEKNTTIGQLQNDLVRLSRQADEIQFKMDELKKLENEMKSLTASITGGQSVPASSAAGSDTTSSSMGGDSSPVTGGDIRKLVASTGQQFAALGTEIDSLSGALAETNKQAQELQHTLTVTPSIWPVDSRTVSSNFGVRIDPFTKTASFHSGLDIAGRTNDPIYAAADGVVLSSGWNKSEGNSVLIDHGNGLRTLYMHLNELVVAKGDRVKKGELIGKMGSTGRSTGPHLHYGIFKNGAAVDPRPYLQDSKKGTKTKPPSAD
ncbi:M23 family metallopeptidase [Paenibacillus ginsengarvi]|uniref:M23 family metallopeptidase n=1 Tax=Paenibacillus ginsengarvi TaxID=400777 RepID=A0A3B0CFK5_9BACL|nr:M23 family metallopeptidase [Paenibacillus ginsengarvi]RKN84050.1 M23 family metallopeptidase [Paenibacillus ginsengarvi]